MKKIWGIAALFTLFILYNFVVSSYSSSGFDATPVAETQQHCSPAENDHASISESSLCQTAPIESLVSVVNPVPPSSPKNPFHDFAAFIQTSEQIIATRFQQYHFFSKNILIRFFQTDIIYPFHCFW